MTAGQKAIFEYHGNNYILTVNQAAVEGQEKSNAVERGMISNDTFFVFEASSGSGIKVIFGSLFPFSVFSFELSELSSNGNWLY